MVPVARHSKLLMEKENIQDEGFGLTPTGLERYYQTRVENFEKERVDVEERLSRISETHEAIHKVRSSSNFRN